MHAVSVMAWGLIIRACSIFDWLIRVFVYAKMKRLKLQIADACETILTHPEKHIALLNTLHEYTGT